MSLMNYNQLIENAWEGGNNCFVVNYATNKIEAVNIEKTYSIPEAKIMDVARELAFKGIEKCGIELRVADLLGINVIGREKEFNKYMKSKGLDKKIKSLGELMRGM